MEVARGSAMRDGITYTYYALRRLAEIDAAHPDWTDEQKHHFDQVARTITRLCGAEEVGPGEINDAERVVVEGQLCYYCPECRYIEVMEADDPLLPGHSEDCSGDRDHILIAFPEAQ